MGELIRARLAARPFVPFRVVLTGGHADTVTDPDLADTDGEHVLRTFWLAPSEPDGRTFRSVISLPHVVSLEDADDAPIVVTAN